MNSDRGKIKNGGKVACGANEVPVGKSPGVSGGPNYCKVEK